MKKVLLLTSLITITITVFISNPFGNDLVHASSSTLKYYGYYGTPWSGEEAVEVSNFSNVAFLGYSETYSAQTLENYINHRENQGYKIILALSGHLYRYLYENNDISESELRRFLNDLKTKLGTNSEKVWAFYIYDEPGGAKDKDGNWIFRRNPEKLDKIINITKEIFPEINTFIVFYTPWVLGSYPLDNENLDLIGIDPYFLSKGYADSVDDPYACNAQNKKQFDREVQTRTYWVKSGGGWIGNAPSQEYIDEIVNSDTDKKIVLVGQSFKCNEYHYPWNIDQMPSACQQEWYYNLSKSDPDIIASLWYRYSSVADLNTYNTRTSQGQAACLGVGRHVPDILEVHKGWGLEVLCTNQEDNPFCAINGVSYKNPDQAKCEGKQVSHPGGSGSGTCDSDCGADEECDGIQPGTGNCNESCQISCYDNYFKVYPSNPGEKEGKYGGDNPNDNACCDNDADCVYQGQCYSDGFYDLDNDERTDMYCYPGGTNNYDWWINVDYHTSYCTGREYYWDVVGGDARVEDAYYTTTGSRPGYCTIGTSGHPSVECCCGDDSGENHAYRAAYKTANKYHISWNEVTSDDACCSTNEKCVFQGTCYDIGAQPSGFNPEGDDNYARCRSGGIHWLDIDYASAACTASGLDWSTAGESGVGEYGSSTDGGDGTTECCGDDASEYMGTETSYSPSGGRWNTPFNDGSSVCCDNDNDISKDQVCYYCPSTSYKSGVNPGGADNYVGCHPAGWWDIDGGQTYCGYFSANGLGWTTSGESSSHGEYGSYTDGGNSSFGGNECCGDDLGENYIYFLTDYDESPDSSLSCDDITDEDCMNGGDDTSDDACCDDDEDCVYKGNCYLQGSHEDLDGDGRIDGWCMTSDSHKGHWRDCDDANGSCGGGCGATWATGGESSQFGEYDTGSEEECCGDDIDEHYITAGAGPVRCCDNTTDCVDSNGTCRSGTEGESYDNCNDGIDNDCDNLTDKDDENCFDPGDLDKDNDIDIEDLAIVTLHLGLTPSNPNWDETADVVPNGEIDIYDIVFVASRFSEGVQTKELHLMFGVRDQTTVDIANKYALEDDFILVKPRERYIELLEGVPKGKRMVLAPSINNFTENIELVRSVNPEYLGYDIEHGTATTEKEKADPVAAVKAVYDFAHENGFKLIPGTDTRWLDDFGAQMANYADMFLIMCGSCQVNNPKVCDKPIDENCTKEENEAYFKEECSRRIQIIKTANPNIPIFVQINTYSNRGKPFGREVTLEEMITSTNSIYDLVDGISVYVPGGTNTTDLWEQYAQWMRD